MWVMAGLVWLRGERMSALAQCSTPKGPGSLVVFGLERPQLHTAGRISCHDRGVAPG